MADLKEGVSTSCLRTFVSVTKMIEQIWKGSPSAEKGIWMLFQPLPLEVLWSPAVAIKLESSGRAFKDYSVGISEVLP